MKLRKISLAVLSVLLSAIAALSGFMVYTQLSDRQKEKEEFDTLAEIVEVTPEKPNDETAVPTDDTSEPVRDLSGLFSQNSDCIGWLCIPDTQLSYPVMHTPDNPQKYLRRSFYGEYSQSGVPFLDWRCNLQSDHLIVYGHNMKNGTMFSSLRNYTEIIIPKWIQEIRKQIGGTMYCVRVHFNEDAKETMKDKIKRMLENDVKASQNTA